MCNMEYDIPTSIQFTSEAGSHQHSAAKQIINTWLCSETTLFMFYNVIVSYNILWKWHILHINISNTLHYFDNKNNLIAYCNVFAFQIGSTSDHFIVLFMKTVYPNVHNTNRTLSNKQPCITHPCNYKYTFQFMIGDWKHTNSELLYLFSTKPYALAFMYHFSFSIDQNSKK